jgi:phosphatidylglycerophosphate synthase
LVWFLLYCAYRKTASSVDIPFGLATVGENIFAFPGSKCSHPFCRQELAPGPRAPSRYCNGAPSVGHTAGMTNPWRARLERWFLPIARRSPLTPNQITIAALLLNLTAALLLALGTRDSRFFLAAPPLLILAGFMDALDGIVARERGLSSRFGDFLDHLADRLSDCFLFAGWAIGASVRIEIAVVAARGVAMIGYAGTQVEATFGIRRYEGLGRGEFVLALVALPVISYSLAILEILRTRFGPFTIPEYFAFLLAGFAALGVWQRVKLARSLSEDDRTNDAPSAVG